MSRSLNQVTLLGRVGADPEIRATANGRVANFSLATSTSWKDAQDQWQEKTQWHKVVAWQNQKGPRLADTCEKYVKKGDLVLVTGMIEYRSWQDKDGNTRYTTEIKADSIIPCKSKSDDVKPTTNARPTGKPQVEEGFEDFPEALDSEDDDLPF